VVLGGATLALVILAVAAVPGWRAFHRQQVPGVRGPDVVDAPRTATGHLTASYLPGSRPPPSALRRTPDSLAAVSTAQLCLAWRGSYPAVAATHDPGVLEQLAVLSR